MKNFLTRGQFYRLASEMESNADEYGRLTLPVATARLQKLFDFEITIRNVEATAKELGLQFQKSRRPARKKLTLDDLRAMVSQAIQENVDPVRVEFVDFRDRVSKAEFTAQVFREAMAEISQIKSRLDALEAAVTAPVPQNGFHAE